MELGWKSFILFINGNQNMIKKCTFDQVHSVLGWIFFYSKNTFQIELNVWGLFGGSWCLQNKNKKTTEKNPIKMYIFFSIRNIINFMHIATLLIKLFLGKTVQPRERIDTTQNMDREFFLEIHFRWFDRSVLFFFWILIFFLLLFALAFFCFF